MAKSLSKSSVAFFLCLLLLLSFSAHIAFSGSVVKYLPGFDGELPFKLETGYITVEESELFYYFIESEGDPTEDPVLLWYSGGPGCSAFNGLIYEIGPLQFNITAYTGGLPSLEYYPYSWTKTASILFVDAPVGTGFSYATSDAAYPTSDTKSASQTFVFLLKWFGEHPNFLNNQFIIGADSYSGISAPILIQEVLNHNLAGGIPYINLKGYILGCPRTDAAINENSKIIFAHRLALISDELYELAKSDCDGDYSNNESSSDECFEDLFLIKKLYREINKNNILEPKCTWASKKPNPKPVRRAFQEHSNDFILSPPKIPDLWCHNFNLALSYIWANDRTVQGALHVRPGSIAEWMRCNKNLNYDMDVDSVVEVHRNLSKSHLQALIYNGDHDLVVPNVGTEQWIKLLNIKIVNSWRPWFLDGEVAGYTEKHSYHGFRLTYATILGAGHTPQEYKRRECYEMFKRWVHWYPL